MFSSKESGKLEVKNDLEVEETLSKNSNDNDTNDVPLDYREKPLSPVLTGGLFNRKFLIGRRSKHKKSRVRLSDRFKDNVAITENQSEIPLPDIDISKFIDDSFSLSQSENLIDQIEKLEQLESKRQYIYKKFVTGDKNDVCFKKPISPAPHKVKRIKVPDKDHKDLDIIESERSEAKACLFRSERESEPKTLPKCSGFQTATGKRISLSEHDLQRHSKLFEDILQISPSLSCDASRNNKYAFLSKDKSFCMKRDGCRVNVRSTLSESDINLEKSSEYVLDSVHSHRIPIEGFKSVIKVSERALKPAENIFYEEQFNDVRFRTDKAISLTQEICESGITNTQMLCAVDDVLNSVECDKNSGDFKGFSKNELVEHRNLLLGFIDVYDRLRGSSNLRTGFNERTSKRSIFSITGTCSNMAVEGKEEFNNTKRVADLPLPPKKRQKNADETDNMPHLENMELTNNFKGFSSAFGKPIKISDTSLKKAQNIFDDIDPNFYPTKLKEIKVHNSGASTTAFGGFSSASGKSIKVSEDSLKKARNIFDNLDLGSLGKADVATTTSNNQKSVSDSSKSIDKVTGDYKMQAQNIFDDVDIDLNISKLKEIEVGNNRASITTFGGFSSASGKSIKVSEHSLKKAKNIFDNLDLGNLGKANVATTTSNNQKSVSDSSKSIDKVAGDYKMQPQNIFDDLDIDLNITKLKEIEVDTNGASIAAFGGFSSASGKSIKVSEDSIKRAKNIFDNMDLEVYKENLGKANLAVTVANNQKSGSHKLEHFDKHKMGNIKGDSTVNSNNFFGAKPNFPGTSSSSICGFQTAGGSKLKISEEALRKAQKAYDTEQEIAVPIEKNFPTKSEDANLALKRKKRLGVSSCKQLQIPDTKLERAKLIFDEDFSKLSPMRPRHNNIYASTPIGQSACTTPTRNDLRSCQSDTFSPIGQSSCVTPVRNDSLKPAKSFNSFFEAGSITPIKVNDVEANFPPIVASKVALMSPSKGGIADWMDELEVDRKKLEDRLGVVIERQRAMECLLKQKVDKDTKPREGILYQSKKGSARLSLRCFVDNKKPGEEVTNLDLFHINPQNAENVHFKGMSSAVITTQDGATIVPNLKDTVGLSEVEIAFRSMPAIEPRLIPNNWVRNHYKWIVWKLASYERMFPAKFTGCLCVENVIQQLKYRYDREIDKAERSALRKIYEKDDAPQKRMVLCVSGIKEVNTNQYELELSDGWYMVRTVIDEPLCNQIARGKIRIGTKLLVFGAELLNCDGCHPLECTNLTYLRINFNSTRRARWHVKLGYQPNPGPFVIRIQSIHPLGGPVGAVKICIVRTYPFKFLERLESRSVWRNKRAEEMRAREWESERCKALEKIHENAKKEFDNSREKQNINLGKRYNNNVSGITCPETLCEIINNSNDPDCVQNLSSSQQAAVLKYQSSLSEKKQHEIAEKISKDVSKLNLTRRDVVAILKLLVVDVDDTPDRAYNFFVWKPDESHTQMLREGTVVTVHNIVPRKNGDLNSCSKTMYRPEPSTFYSGNKLDRRVTEIVELTRQDLTPTFNEFDTVGIVVNINVDVRSQEVWLADTEGRLLLVTVYEGPTTCLLLDNLKRGQATTICNLVYRGIKEDIVQAVANHFTVFSCYSQYKHLQERLEVFKKELPKDIDTLINNCDKRIELFRLKVSNSRRGIEDSDEDTLVSSRITSTDVALSLIDLDKFI